MADAAKRVLIVAEAVTLAHVARPLVVARGMREEGFDVAIAANEAAARHVDAAGLPRIPMRSIKPVDFIRALASGRALYSASTLESYVTEDLRIIEQFAPELIVGDFRLSLSVSARLAGIPYATISSAYWSPGYEPQRWPVPVLPFTRWMPIPMAQGIFDLVRPLAFRLHCRPLNAVRIRFGLAPLPSDLRLIYTDADYVLYSDLPSLFPLSNLPREHVFVGPMLWEPQCKPPSWWNDLPSDRPLVYVTMGSSGDSALMPKIIESLSELPMTIVAASAGQRLPAISGKRNVHIADYLPGVQAALRAQLVVCNGGSLTAYQAVSAGVPLLGVTSNLDQFLNMQGLERAGAGRGMRADRLDGEELRSAAQRLIEGPAAHERALSLQREFQLYEPDRLAADFARSVLADGRGTFNNAQPEATV